TCGCAARSGFALGQRPNGGHSPNSFVDLTARQSLASHRGGIAARFERQEQSPRPSLSFTASPRLSFTASPSLSFTASRNARNTALKKPSCYRNGDLMVSRTISGVTPQRTG